MPWVVLHILAIFARGTKMLTTHSGLKFHRYSVILRIHGSPIVSKTTEPKKTNLEKNLVNIGPDLARHFKTLYQKREHKRFLSNCCCLT